MPFSKVIIKKILNRAHNITLTYDYNNIFNTIYAGNENDQNFQGGILAEVSNFDRKLRFLALLSHN